MPTDTSSPAKPPAKVAAKRPARKAAPPRGAKRPAAKPPTRPAGDMLDQNSVRHIKFSHSVWERASVRARKQGRGVQEVLRQLLAEYADSDTA